MDNDEKVSSESGFALTEKEQELLSSLRRFDGSKPLQMRCGQEAFRLSVVRYVRDKNDDEIIGDIRQKAAQGKSIPVPAMIIIGKWLLNHRRIDPIFQIIKLQREAMIDDSRIDEFESTLIWALGDRKRGLDLAKQAAAKWLSKESLRALVEAMESMLKDEEI